ncbi:MAG: hypothetical protein ABI315_14215 [Bacteroidia bacterium]
MKRFIEILFILFFTTSAFLNAQNTNPNSILNKIYTKTQKASDYSVEAHIKVDMPFIRMLPIDAKIYFKQKDKFKVESKSIAIVPRQGFDQASQILKDTTSFTAIYQGTELIDKIKTSVINIIPLSDTTDLILAKLWVNTDQNLILKSQLTTKSNGTILTEYSYGTQAVFGLPDKMIFSVDIKKFRMPKGVITNSKDEVDPSKENKKGRIFITLTNYQVNKGIPDNFFNKKN